MIYPFKCSKCDAVADFDFPIGEAPQEHYDWCDTCQPAGDRNTEESPHLHRRVYTPAGIIFKGTGWGSGGKSRTSV